MSVTGVERLPAARPIDLAQSGGSYGSVNGSKNLSGNSRAFA
jgi:hypothetical protein